MARTKIPVEFSSTPGIVDNSSATAITIDSAGAATFSGAVGIGTDNPGYLLTVKKDVDAFAVKIENDGNSAGTSGASYADASDGLWVDTRWNTATNTPFKVTSNSGTTPMMIIKGDGKVGIGTESMSSSYGRLTVAGTGISITPDTAAKMQIGRYNAANPYSYIKAGSTSLGFKFTNAADTIDLFTVENSGNVGIGKAVNSAVRLSVGSPESTASSYGLEVCNASSNTRFLVDGLGTTTFYKSDNAEIARIGEYNNSCNILIGATAPTHVISSDSARNKLYIEGQYPSISIIGGDNGNANHGPTLQFGNILANDLHWVIGSGNTSAQLDIGWGTPTNKNPHNGIAGYSGGGGGATMMRITSTGVGVGGNWGYYGTIANPAYPLHVQGTASATQYNRGAVEMGRIIIHEQQLAATNHSLSGSTTAWTDTGLTKTITPQSAKSYFWVEIYHNEHINPNTPNYGGGLRLMGGSTEISRGGEMEYQSGTWASGADYRYNGNAKTWGGWYNPATASAIVFKAQAAAPNSQAGNYYYWHWQSNYIANQTGPRLRIIEFT